MYMAKERCADWYSVVRAPTTLQFLQMLLQGLPRYQCVLENSSTFFVDRFYMIRYGGNGGKDFWEKLEQTQGSLQQHCHNAANARLASNSHDDDITTTVPWYQYVGVSSTSSQREGVRQYSNTSVCTIYQLIESSRLCLSLLTATMVAAQLFLQTSFI